MSKVTVQLVHPDGSPAREPLVVDLFNRRLALDGGLLKLFKARVLKVHQGSPLAEDREGLSRQEFEPGANVLLEVLEAEETGGPLYFVSPCCASFAVHVEVPLNCVEGQLFWQQRSVPAHRSGQNSTVSMRFS